MQLGGLLHQRKTDIQKKRFQKEGASSVKTGKFNKALKEHGVKKVLSMYMQDEIFLTNRQLEIATSLNDGRGGALLKYNKKSIENKPKK